MRVVSVVCCYEYNMNIVGITTVVTALFGGYVPCTSLSRSTIVSDLDPHSNIATLITAVVLLSVLLFVGPLFKYVPMCVLAAIIMVSLKGSCYFL
jgi:MFS superfamily sulfate permease-like transporter